MNSGYLSERFRIIASVPTTPELRDRFRSGLLRDAWAERYKILFDEMDHANAKNQPEGHFFEWLAAVVLYETTDCPSLMQKYQFSKHKRKREILEELGASRLIEFFSSQHDAFGSRQAPDLLVYAPDYSDFFFCEVKGPLDRLRPEQAKYFEAVSNVSEKETVLFHVDMLTTC